MREGHGRRSFLRGAAAAALAVKPAVTAADVPEFTAADRARAPAPSILPRGRRS